ncbi:Regulatory-associated protein of TOR 1 [Glycine soja]|uniref:Regulatory-associated protein of TOR 1 n=1 Tax=Glycine soja TaxID=3848 RepID=A0A445L8M4_GLYSO|nr:Regulatory-associated protein of TOR 1 [Glycine soja]
MKSYPARALDRRLEVDWARDAREGPRVLISHRAFELSDDFLTKLGVAREKTLMTQLVLLRIWNHEEATLLNTFGNHHFPDRGISKLCLVNELDDSLLLDASFDGNIQIWKDYLLKGKQKLVIAFSSIHGHKPGVRSLSAVVDWQQQCDYPYASGEISSIMLWDVDKEQLVNSKSSSSDCSVSVLVSLIFA